MSNFYTWERSRTDFDYMLLLGTIEQSPVCITFVKTELSPPDFEQSQKEYNKACAWKKELLEKLPKPPLSEYPELNYNDYRPRFAITDTVLSDLVGFIEKCFRDYTDTRNSMLDYQKQIAKNETELMLFFISPYLFITALALQCTKVTADRKRSRDN